MLIWEKQQEGINAAKHEQMMGELNRFPPSEKPGMYSDVLRDPHLHWFLELIDKDGSIEILGVFESLDTAMKTRDTQRRLTNKQYRIYDNETGNTFY